MKPHEETWIYRPHGVVYMAGTIVATDGPRKGEAVETGEASICFVPPGEDHRAALISAAPDMARLLMNMRFGTDHYSCHSCGHATGHYGTCEWIRVMRKAGVIE